MANRTPPPPRMEWEKPYLEALIDQLQPSGHVLEVGFSLGFSSDRIQVKNQIHHTIIEADPEKAEKARIWALNRLNVTIIQNNWQQVLPQLGVFDAIFFNEIDLEVLVDTHRPKKFGNLLVQSGKDLNAKVTALFPQITTLRYTEADIDGLFQIVGRSSSKAFTTFLTELKENGQISHEQYTSTLLKYGLQPSFPRMKDPMLEFLEAVLPHMQKGSRFSCFASFAVSLFENPDFFASIITHPDLLYTETWMSIDVPENCSYYKGTKALLMRVEKVNN